MSAPRSQTLPSAEIQDRAARALGVVPLPCCAACHQTEGQDAVDEFVTAWRSEHGRWVIGLSCAKCREMVGHRTLESLLTEADRRSAGRLS